MGNVFELSRSLRIIGKSCTEAVTRGVLRQKVFILAKFTGKHLSQSLFLNKVAGLRPSTLLKEELWYRCFPLNFTKLLRTHILKNIWERPASSCRLEKMYKLNDRDLLLLPCLVQINISLASCLFFFYLRFRYTYLFWF